eukprot:12567934-Ditylum_brightwellii.AAC.1
MATYPNTVVQFHANNMILHIHSDAAYMVLPEARSCTGRLFYLSSQPDKVKEIPLNCAMHNECSTSRNVMGSMAETGVGRFYINCQRGEEFRMVMQEMGHLQPPTIVTIDNSNSAEHVQWICNSIGYSRKHFPPIHHKKACNTNLVEYKS